MYNQKYIDCFDEEKYKEIIGDKLLLKEIADMYINQFEKAPYDATIAFKESLDHYVLKMIKTVPGFIESNEFLNYVSYLTYIFYNKVTNKDLRLEFNTNVVMSDPLARKVIFYKFNSNVRNTLDELIRRNDALIHHIGRKLENRAPLSQEELNLVGDYLYNKRDLESPLYTKFVDYLLNEIKVDTAIKFSPQIGAAYMSYLPKFYGSGVENSRVIYSNGYACLGDYIIPTLLDAIVEKEKDFDKSDKTLRNLGLYSYSDKYVSISDEYFDLDLTSEKGLDLSRTTKNRDLYWLAMVVFHELTHQYQSGLITSEEFNSSGFAYIIKCLIHNRKDYSDNHDSYEMEIEADEVAWEKMYWFISKHIDSISIGKSLQLRKCMKNKSAVYSRRTFLTKKDGEFDIDYFQADLNRIKSNLKNPKFREFFNKMYEMCPMMRRVFHSDGRINSKLLLDENITSKNSTGTDNIIMGTEVAKSIFVEGFKQLKRYIIENDVSKEQVSTLLLNIYNTYHLDKMFVRELSRVDFNQFVDTRHNYDLSKIRDKYFYKFREVAYLIYRERAIVYIIKKKYPNYDLSDCYDPKYATYNFDDMFNFLYQASNGVVTFDELSDVIDFYERSGDEVLVGLASKLRRFLTYSDNIGGPSL